MQLRPYQQTAIAQTMAALDRGSNAPLLVLPTGGGKTVVAGELVRLFIETHGGGVLFLAPRRELVHQASGKLREFGIDHGVLLAGREDLRNTLAPVQIASIDTAQSRLRRRNVLPAELTNVGLVIVDEAHLAITSRRQFLLNHWPNAIRIGLTATPTRRDGRALGALFDCLIEPTTTKQLTDEGYLARARYFSIAEPDLRGVRTVGGDYHQGDLEAAMNRREMVGDVVATWLQHASDRRTIVFASSVAHSIALEEAFLRAGVAAEHVDGTMPTITREATIRRFRTGDTQVLTNCFVASFGFDVPEVSCITLARPTKSLMLYLQMIGRGLRVIDGKQNCLVLDHSGCVHRLGFAADDRAWTLEGQYALQQRYESSQSERPAPTPIECPECHCVFAGTQTCPECGYHFRKRGREIETLDGELVEIGELLSEEEQDRLKLYLELKGYAETKHYKSGFAAIKYKEKFSEWPPRKWQSMQAAKPSIKTMRWIQSRMIAWAKKQQKIVRAS